MKDLTEFLDINGIPHAARRASDITTFKVGGPCTVVYPGSERELISVVDECVDSGIKFVVLGCGSNVLFRDSGYDGAVILTQSLNPVRVEADTVYAGCGAPLHTICRAAYDAGLSGAEFAYGIPGSLGGAVFMNAGAYGGEMKDIVSSVTAYSVADRRTVTLSCEECGFGYRHSVFEDNGFIVLSASLRLSRGDKTEIRALMDDLINRRKTKQPLNYPSAGSTFKRYPGRYTGQMIEEAGLKGFTVGGAQVSEKHAGFVINKGGATAEDILNLIDRVKAVIKEREGIDIECEIRVID